MAAFVGVAPGGVDEPPGPGPPVPGVDEAELVVVLATAAVELAGSPASEPDEPQAVANRAHAALAATRARVEDEGITGPSGRGRRTPWQADLRARWERLHKQPCPSRGGTAAPARFLCAPAARGVRRRFEGLGPAIMQVTPPGAGTPHAGQTRLGPRSGLEDRVVAIERTADDEETDA